MRVVLVALAAAVALSGAACRKTKKQQRAATRAALWKELQPVALKNCTLQRFGGPNDGGYLMCANLIDGVQSTYSYGIDTEDNWGCEMSKRFGVPVHQYDCFTPHRPTCEGGEFHYNNECIGAKAETLEGRPFDTLANQIKRNGDATKRLVVKIDIEGAEWESLMATPPEVLDRIDQMPMELHGVHDARSIAVVQKLKQQFHLVSVHFNNYGCSSSIGPFPSDAYQVLWVNKRLAEVDPGKPAIAPGAPPQAPDATDRPDCQTLAASR